MMSFSVAETVVRVTERFAQTCYQHGYGCAQSVTSCKVLPVLLWGSELSVYVEMQQGQVNSFVERLIQEYGRGDV